MIIVTEIEDRCSPKPFLGGWRNVNRNLEYHDAASQTKSIDFAESRFVSVLTQTFPRIQLSDRSINVGGIERSVQVECFFPEISDFIVKPRDKEEMKICNAALIIQRWYRVCRSRQRSQNVDKSCLSGKLDSLESEDNNNNDIIDDQFSISSFESITEDYQCKRNTSAQNTSEFHILNNSSSKVLHTRSDLAILSNLLERWNVAEELKIRESQQFKTDSSMVKNRVDKLEREVEVLRAIENSRSELARRKSERSRAKFLDTLAKPVLLRGSGSPEKSISIDTVNVQRAREFRDIYESLMTPDDPDNDFAYNTGHRIELLCAVKKLASQHTCRASTNLEDLIEQELYLLASSRVEPEGLRHLRNRIRLAFLSLARSALMPHDERVKLSMKTRLCPSCHRLRGLEAFETDHRERISRTCVDCTALRSRRYPEICLEIYERMLRELRRNEAARRDGASSLSFVMGPKAIQYLVSNIWHGRSVFSDCDELERLRLTRLDPRKPWTPWNNLLATRREARMHEVLASDSLGPPTVYDEELIRKCKRMNLQARLYFEAMTRHSESGASL